jgi:uncharacterized protein
MQPKPREKNSAARQARRCPICGKPASEADHPFCSRRCADIDLHRWLSGGYAVPAQPDDETDDSAVNEAPPEQD